jgi:hypothetical protein
MKRLASLLNENEAKLRKIVNHLEELSGYGSQDVRLLARMQQDVTTKVDSLGLDARDTDGEELYEALRAKLAADFAQAARAWGIRSDNKTGRVIALCAHSGEAQPVLSVRCSSMKRLLSATPPKKVMKLLNYRSADSLLKREDTRSVVALALTLESAQWNSRLAHKIRKLASADFETRDIEYIDLTAPKYEHIGHPAKPVTYLPLMGAVVFWPNDYSAEMTPSLVLLALQAEEILAAESHYLSNKQFSPEFAATAERIFSNFEPLSLNIAGQNYMDYLETSKFLRRSSGHSAVARFSRLHPALHWWRDTAGLASAGVAPVSLHIGDVAASLAGRLGFDNRRTANFCSELKLHLLAAYMPYSGVKNYLADQIDGTLIALEELTTPTNLVPQAQEAY